MDDSNDESEDRGSERTCIGCRQKASRGELARFVSLLNGVPVRDEKKQLPGRGAWLHDDPECMQLALSRRAFIRAGLPILHQDRPSGSL